MEREPVIVGKGKNWRCCRTEGNGTNCASNRVVLPPCFAAIDLVTEGSPADQDGIKVGDRVAVFGSVNADNFGALSDVGR